jgi:hypothetical protein
MLGYSEGPPLETCAGPLAWAAESDVGGWSHHQMPNVRDNRPLCHP